MTPRMDIAGLDGARAVVLHPGHDRLPLLLRQLRAIGLTVEIAWPELPASAVHADVVLYDADLGHDAQFPWKPGEAQMPMVALVGSEAPGRLEWASRMGADALLMKPLGAEGVFAALLVARQAFELRRSLAAEIASLRQRLSARQTVVQAVNILARKAVSEDAAYDQLRQLAMAWQVTIEAAAVQVVESARKTGGLRDCN
ncbi:Two-component response regulator, AmiR/NasT family, consists of REC and RNA-binding antiterminator (ANTAR) domains [Jannaschia faecimaris]|uniref:Two-component response regulator, AmiR/NasT family, consists of REC and RNA-binding antiterminator (ANTAR) domains n=1 Tax=Jannaschia faecimaris TaxID=1244108 RepID=A0A1H3TJ29_9RHOB|nr:ANTAR domain-containing protein [Jannaschia faecimaris]SDZ50216.1 Two-component response regulator, AmiR/NasT family, consists of REC and RNA-binding antiterminator (ANTAR) domains [Jannaschia faecimaris]